MHKYSGRRVEVAHIPWENGGFTEEVSSNQVEKDELKFARQREGHSRQREEREERYGLTFPSRPKALK